MSPRAKKNRENLLDPAVLRSRAEAQYIQKPVQRDAGTEIDAQRLLHELQVHQIELEMQNEALRQTRTEMEAALERYTDLYDYAPVGYFTLGRDGNIRQVNFYGARLLGLDRFHLMNRPFGFFVQEADRPIFSSFLANVFDQMANSTCEISLGQQESEQRSSKEQSVDKAAPIMVQIQASAAEDGQTCRAVVMDITERKQNEASLRWMAEQNLRRTEELESLTYISATMRQANTLSTMIPLLVVQSVHAMKSQTGIMALIDGASLVFSSGVGKWEFSNGIMLPKGNDLLWEFVRSGELQVFDHLSENNAGFEKNSFLDRLTQDLGACIIAPLKKEHVTIGLLILGYSRSIIFSVNQMRLVTAISDMAGSALHRMNITVSLEKMAEDRSRELESISHVISTASESTDLKGVLPQVMRLILSVVNAKIGRLILLDEDGKHTKLSIDEGMSAGSTEAAEDQNIETSLEGWVIRHNKSLILPNTDSTLKLDWKSQLHEQQVYASLPMRIHGRVVGVVSVSRSDGRQFDRGELNMLSIIAHQLGLIAENLRLSNLLNKGG